MDIIKKVVVKVLSRHFCNVVLSIVLAHSINQKNTVTGYFAKLLLSRKLLIDTFKDEANNRVIAIASPRLGPFSGDNR